MADNRSKRDSAPGNYRAGMLIHVLEKLADGVASPAGVNRAREAGHNAHLVHYAEERQVMDVK